MLVIVGSHDGMVAGRSECEMRHTGRHALVPGEGGRELEREVGVGQRRRDHEGAAADASTDRLALDLAAVELDFERDRRVACSRPATVAPALEGGFDRRWREPLMPARG